MYEDYILEIVNNTCTFKKAQHSIHEIQFDFSFTPDEEDLLKDFIKPQTFTYLSYTPNEPAVHRVHKLGKLLRKKFLPAEVLSILKKDLAYQKPVRLRICATAEKDFYPFEAFVTEELYEHCGINYFVLSPKLSLVRSPISLSRKKLSPPQTLNVLFIINENGCEDEQHEAENLWKYNFRKNIFDDIKAIESIFLKDKNVLRISHSGKSNPLINPSGDEILRALSSHQYHIIHYFGHICPGEVGDEFSGIPDGKGHIPFSKIREGLQKNPDTRLVALFGCKSWHFLARELIRMGIPCVIGMQGYVSDQIVQVMFRKFYETLLGKVGIEIDEAVFALRTEAENFCVQKNLKNSKDEKVSHYATPVLYLGTGNGKIFPSPEEAALGNYLDYLIERYQNIENNIGQKLLTMDDYYIPLRFEEKTTETEQKEPHKSTWDISQRLERSASLLDIEGILRKNKRAVVMGEPGVGKSTLLKNLTYLKAKEAMQALKNESEACIPIFLELKNVNHSKTIPRMLSEECKLHGKEQKAFEDALWYKIKNKKCLILLDALDEVTQKRDALINKLKNSIQNNQVILTTRKVGYAFELKNQNFKHFEALGFQDEDVKTYVEKYFDENEERAAELLTALDTHSQMKALSRIPLLLDIMCYVCEDGKVKLPARRAELYQIAIEKMLERREPWYKGRLSDVIGLLQRVAFYFFNKEISPFPEKDLYNIVQSEMKKYGKWQKDRSELLTEIVYKSGLLKKSGTSYDFMHLTFQEYLTAKYIVERVTNDVKISDLKKLREVYESKIWDDRWEEVLRLISSLLTDSSIVIETINNCKADILSMLFDKCLKIAGDAQDIVETLKEKIRKEIAEDIVGKKVRHDVTAVSVYAQNDSGLFQHLLNCFNQNNSVNGKLFILNTLGKIRELRALSLLIELLKYPDRYVRGMAAYALGEIQDTRAAEPLMELIEDDSQHWEVRWAASWALAQMKDRRVVAFLLGLLGDSCEAVSCVAVNALSDHKDAQIIQPLIELLKDRDMDVGFASAEVLGNLKDSRAVEPVINLLRNSNSTVRCIIASALGGMEDLRATGTLIELLKDHDKGVVCAAVRAIAKLRDSRALVPLIDLINDEDVKVQRQAIKALGELKDPRAVPPLIELLKSENNDRGVWWDVVESLGKLKKSCAFELLIKLFKEKHGILGEGAVRTLMELKDACVIDPLVELLKDSNEIIRERVVRVLGTIKHPRAVEPLIELLKDRRVYVKEEAIEALGELKDHRAVEPLIRLLKCSGKSVRQEAVSALSRIGGERAVKAILSIGKVDSHDLYNACKSSIPKLTILKDGEIIKIQDLIKLLNDF